MNEDDYELTECFDDDWYDEHTESYQELRDRYERLSEKELLK
jgi:hypothetical protein